MIRENPENIRKMLKDRDVQFDLDLLLDLDKKRREMIISTDELRKKKNEMSVKISEAKKTGSEVTPIIQEMQLVSQELAKLEEVQHETELEYSKLALTIPNVLHESVPRGDDSANKEIRKWGTTPQFDFEVKDHIDISENLNLLELDKKRREMIISTDNLRKKKNEMSIKISEAKKTGSEAVPLIQEMQLVSQELAKLEEVQHETELEYSKLALTIPNVLHKLVPCGAVSYTHLRAHET